MEAQLRAETGGMRDDFGMRKFNASRPKLLAFDKQTDDMDAYLERYKFFANTQGWDEVDWAVSLSPLLTRRDYRSTLVCHQTM